jgi:hypothetical protein
MRTHTFYTADDFTPEEISRDNLLAAEVIKKGRDICKLCGATPNGITYFSPYCKETPRK